MTRIVAALRFPVLTGWYDRVISALLPERRIRERLVDQAALRSGDRVLDLGCGTATLTILLERSCPQARVVGLDGDPGVLRIARRKVRTAGSDVNLLLAMGQKLPLGLGSIDKITSSLFFHHLTTATKLETLVALHAALRPGGEIHVADWGRPQNAAMRVAFLGVRVLDGFSPTADAARGAFPELLGQSGFRDIRVTHRQMTAFGTLEFYRASSFSGQAIGTLDAAGRGILTGRYFCGRRHPCTVPPPAVTLCA